MRCEGRSSTSERKPERCARLGERREAGNGGQWESKLAKSVRYDPTLKEPRQEVLGEEHTALWEHKREMDKEGKGERSPGE